MNSASLQKVSCRMSSVVASVQRRRRACAKIIRCSSPYMASRRASRAGSLVLCGSTVARKCCPAAGGAQPEPGQVQLDPGQTVELLNLVEILAGSAAPSPGRLAPFPRPGQGKALAAPGLVGVAATGPASRCEEIDPGASCALDTLRYASARPGRGGPRRPPGPGRFPVSCGSPEPRRKPPGHRNQRTLGGASLRFDTQRRCVAGRGKATLGHARARFATLRPGATWSKPAGNPKRPFFRRESESGSCR
jgi:hypothetical protein